jgi:FKBP-type peptidyl-prolyl cis-trans isomerase SlyD
MILPQFYLSSPRRYIDRVIVMASIHEGDFIRLTYTGSYDDTIFDTTDEEKAKEADIFNPSAKYGPVVIRVGNKHVILGLDDDLPGKEPGYSGEIDIPPEKAFGAHDPDRVESFPKSTFKEKPVRGQHVKIEEKGEGVIIDAIGGRVLVDFNHPLSGKTLHYTYTIDEEVEDAEEQLKGLIQLYAGRDLEMTIENGIVTITLPPGITYDRRWVLWRSRIIHEAFEAIPAIEEIVLVETFKRPASESTTTVESRMAL